MCCDIVSQVEGKPVLRFASAYGFRNIQGVVKQMKVGCVAFGVVSCRSPLTRGLRPAWHVQVPLC